MYSVTECNSNREKQFGSSKVSSFDRRFLIHRVAFHCKNFNDHKMFITCCFMVMRRWEGGRVGVEGEGGRGEDGCFSWLLRWRIHVYFSSFYV
jgi:hypothetical protein